jgi:beta-xylosidase
MRPDFISMLLFVSAVLAAPPAGADSQHPITAPLTTTVSVTTGASVATTASAADPNTYRNPLAVGIGDPFVLHDGGSYYLYGTRHAARGFEVFSSRDLAHWRERGFVLEKQPGSWAQGDFWAPEVVRSGGRFFMFHVGASSEEKRRSVCVAVADSPLGPFREERAPLLPGPEAYTDPHPFRDPATGEWWLYVTRDGPPPSRILAARLKPSLTELATTLTECLVGGQAWEAHGWIEGPFVMERGGTYHMLYSGGYFWEPGYAIGAATAPSPAGLWTKFDGNPVLKAGNGVTGPGHCSVTDSPDGKELFVAYHRHESLENKERVLAIDRVRFARPSPGMPEILMPAGDAPTSSPQPMPSGARRL